MAIDFSALIDRHVYRAFGVDATLTPVAGAPVTIRVTDETGPTEAPGDDGVFVRSLEPHCLARMPELLAAGITRAALSGAQIEFNFKRYRISSTDLLPSPRGEFDGEIELYLIELGGGDDVVSPSGDYLVSPSGDLVVGG